MADNTKFENEVDVSQLSTIEEQKECCDQMIGALVSEENRLKNRFTSIQTVQEIMDSNNQLKLDLSEYLGYHYGSINESMELFETAIAQLQRVISNETDNLDLGARGMYIALWYNLAVLSVESTHKSVNELEKIESEMISRIVTNKSEETVYMRERFH